MRELTVVGSVNADLTASATRLPRPGETVIAHAFHTFFGGKGANQACAARAMGARVRFVGCVGDDELGRRSRANLARLGIDVGALHTVDVPTGVALITVDDEGRNLITVASGANERVHADGVHDVVLMQLETPYVWPSCRMRILNPAPARDVDLRGVDVVIPNEIEAEVLTGERDPARAALALQRRGARRAIITLGGRGVFADGRMHAPFEVDAIDTVGAGDAFCGAFAAAIALEIADEIRFAQACAALAVTRRGAQSLPTRAAVDALLARRN